MSVVVSRYSVTYFCITAKQCEGWGTNAPHRWYKFLCVCLQTKYEPPPPTLIVQCGMVVKIVTKFSKFLARIAAYKTDTILIVYGAP